MASQEDDEIIFTTAHASERLRFRLLELPQDLLEVLSQPDPPTLQLKSSPAEAGRSNALAATKPQSAVLCTPSKTYNIAQVNTSNSVFVVCPAEPTSNGAREGLSADAQCRESLELQPSTGSAMPYLVDALQSYHAPYEEQGYTGFATEPRVPNSGRSKASVFSDIPFSEAECEEAWVALAAFEREGLCYRPTPRAVLELWRALLSGMIIRGDSFDGDCCEDDLWQFLVDDEFPRGMFSAVLSRMTDETSLHGVLRFKKEECVSWIGRLHLQDMGKGGQQFGIREFVHAWNEDLPEQWRGGALESIKDAYIELAPGIIVVRNEDSTELSTAASAALSVSGNSTTKRKWHDKFRPNKASKPE